MFPLIPAHAGNPGQQRWSRGPWVPASRDDGDEGALQSRPTAENRVDQLRSLFASSRREQGRMLALASPALLVIRCSSCLPVGGSPGSRSTKMLHAGELPRIFNEAILRAQLLLTSRSACCDAARVITRYPPRLCGRARPRDGAFDPALVILPFGPACWCGPMRGWRCCSEPG